MDKITFVVDGRATLSVEGAVTLHIDGSGVTVTLESSHSEVVSLIPAQPEVRKDVEEIPPKQHDPAPAWPANVPNPGTAKLRAWARRNGHHVGVSGQIRREIKDAYISAHTR